MKYFVKLNLFAFLYGFALFIETELMGNAYRLERITHWFDFTVDKVSVIILFIVITIIFCLITAKHFNTGKLKYILTIYWIPYYAVMILLCSYLIPITNSRDDPAPALGIVLFLIWFIYPFYIAAINAIFDEKTKKILELLKNKPKV